MKAASSVHKLSLSKSQEQNPSSSSSVPMKKTLTPQGTLLHDDILIEVLSKLPVKTLLKLRCVSKSWHSLIGDKINSKKLPPAMLGIFNKRSIIFIGLRSRTYIDPSSVDTTLSFIPSPSRLYVADSCNGLLLLQDHNFRPPRLYICNPATRKWAHIPDPPSSDSSNRYPQFALAYDSSRGSHYSILCLHSRCGFQALDSVFSSKTSKWRKCADLDLLLSWGKDFTSLNGVLYTVITSRQCVLAVDLERNLCQRIPFAEVMNSRMRNSTWHYQCIGHSGGLLHFALTVDRLLVVFALVGNAIVLKHEISLQAVLDKFAAGVCLNLSVIAFHQDLDLIFLRFKGKLILSYHLVSREVDEVDNTHDCYFLDTQWFSYTPSYSEDMDCPKECQGT